MTYIIEQQLLTITQKNLISKSFVIAHESGNANNTGALSLENEIAYMKRMAQKNGAFTSHWVGGGGRIVQIAQTGKVQYGAGKNANPHAYAQVELARTSNPALFKKDYLAYVWLLKKLAVEAGIPTSLNTGTTLASKGIKTHHWISNNIGGTNHSDPDAYLMQHGISLTQFAHDLSSTTQKDFLSPSSPTKPNHLYHIVVKGDSLWSIAKKYHTTITWLKTINLLSSETILVGQKLIISTNSSNPAPLSQFAIIKTIQKTLGIKQDGLFGPVTKQSLIRLVQKTIGSKPDGYWGPESASKMRILKTGLSGWDVYVVQAFLTGNYQLNLGTPDNHYGPKTTAAVRQFQHNFGLLADGITGPKTCQKLFS